MNFVRMVVVVGDHGLAAAGAENQTFQKGIAGETIGAVDAGVGGLSCGVKTGDGSVSPEIGFDSSHHVVSSGADRSHVGGQIEAIAEAGGVDTRETFLQEFGGLGGHVEINVLRIGAMHFADNGASDDIARGELLGFGVALGGPQ